MSKAYAAAHTNVSGYTAISRQKARMLRRGRFSDVCEASAAVLASQVLRAAII